MCLVFKLPFQTGWPCTLLQPSQGLQDQICPSKAHSPVQDKVHINTIILIVLVQYLAYKIDTGCEKDHVSLVCYSLRSELFSLHHTVIIDILYQYNILSTATLTDLQVNVHTSSKRLLECHVLASPRPTVQFNVLTSKFHNLIRNTAVLQVANMKLQYCCYRAIGNVVSHYRA